MKRLTILAAAVAAITVAANASSQTYTVYNNRAAFVAALSDPLTETFNEYSSDQFATTGVPLVVGDVSITKVNTGLTKIDTPPYSSSNTIDGTNSLAVVGDIGHPNLFRFSRNIVAFGVDLLDLNNESQRSAFSVNGQLFYTPALPNRTISFFGLISNEGFSGFDIVHTDVDAYNLDNLTYQFVAAPTNPTPMPEPATWAMMAGGFGLAGSALRRRGAAAKTTNVC